MSPGLTYRAIGGLLGFALVAAACSGTTTSPTPSAIPAASAAASAVASAAASAAASASPGEAVITATPGKDLCPPNGATWTIGYDTFSDTQEFAAARWRGLQDWQQKLGCITFVKTVDNADGATALANVKTFINRKVDAVLLLQVVSDVQAGIVQELDAANIPVVATDILAPGAPFLSASDAGVGQQAGDALVAAYQASGATDAPWVVLVTTVAAGPEVGKRMDGVEQVLKAKLGIPDNHILKGDVTTQTTENAYNAVLQLQNLLPDGATVLVSGVNDELALGAYQALSKTPGLKLHVVGIGGLSAGLQAVCKYPAWYATVDYNPYGQTAYIVSELMQRLNGLKLPDVFYTPANVLDKAGVQATYPQACQ